MALVIILLVNLSLSIAAPKILSKSSQKRTESHLYHFTVSEYVSAHANMKYHMKHMSCTSYREI